MLFQPSHRRRAAKEEFVGDRAPNESREPLRLIGAHCDGMHADYSFTPHVPACKCVDLPLGIKTDTFADMCDNDTALGDEHRA